MQMNNFLMSLFLSLLPVTHFSSCFFSVLLLVPFPSPFPSFSTSFILLSFLSGWSNGRGWYSGIALKPSHSSSCSHGAWQFFLETVPSFVEFQTTFYSFLHPDLAISISQLKNPNPDSQGNSLFQGQGVACSEDCS